MASKCPRQSTEGFAHSVYSAYLWEKQRADERTRTAYPCSSYEFACVHTSPYWCVRKLRLFRRFLMIWRLPFVHCVPVRIREGCSTVAVSSALKHRWPGGADKEVVGRYVLLLGGHGARTRRARNPAVVAVVMGRRTRCGYREIQRTSEPLTSGELRRTHPF